MSDTNQPAETLRDGKLKVTIWFNEQENAPPFSAVPSCSYKDKDDQWKDVNRYTGKNSCACPNCSGRPITANGS